jgi:hypothetical protein
MLQTNLALSDAGQFGASSGAATERPYGCPLVLARRLRLRDRFGWFALRSAWLPLALLASIVRRVVAAPLVDNSDSGKKAIHFLPIAIRAADLRGTPVLMKHPESLCAVPAFVAVKRHREPLSLPGVSLGFHFLFLARGSHPTYHNLLAQEYSPLPRDVNLPRPRARPAGSSPRIRAERSRRRPQMGSRSAEASRPRSRADSRSGSSPSAHCPCTSR